MGDSQGGNAIEFGPDVDQVHRHQVRVAYRLADRYADRLMYVYRVGWHTWDGRRWVEDARGQAERAVLDVLREALADSLDDQELRKDVRRCESATGVNGVLDLASKLEPFAFTVSDLDADPYLVAVANGTLDLRTLEVRPHDPADRITKAANASYTPSAPSSGRWTEFLEQVLPDPEVRGFVQRLAGIGLLGQVVEHVLAIFTGTGANGKSVLYKALGHAFGDYAMTAEPDLFMHRDRAHPTGEMDLRGVRWVVVSESDKDRRLAEATMKRLTGGDPIRARRMRQDFVQFEPSHTAVLVTNHLPKVSGDDPAIWRRIRVVPFTVVIPEAEQDRHLGDALQLDADAILTWAIEGYRHYAADESLADPEAVRVATDEYQADSDAIARFIADCCLISPHAHATTGELFERWAGWARTEGVDQVSQKAFGQSLDRHGYPAGKGGRAGRKRRGIGLLAEDDGDD